LDRLGDGFRISEVILLSLRIGAHVFGRHQAGVMAKHLEPATEVMRANAGLHADQAQRQVGKPRFHLAARPLLPQHDGTAVIMTMMRNMRGESTSVRVARIAGNSMGATADE
jgi:hypothetical protein